jgi:hypothetical protein
MILGTHGIIASQIVGIDPDWLAYYNRVIADGGSLTTTEQNATKTLVADLKAYGIWSAMKAIYPMVGASSAACAQNLKSSSFTGSFSSGWTFASTGATPNGTSAYMNTNLIPDNSLSLNNTHLSFYSRSNVSPLIYSTDIGTNDNATTYLPLFKLNIKTTTNNFENLQYSFETLQILTVSNTDSRGFFIGSRISSTSNKSFKNGTLLGTNTTSNNQIRMSKWSVYLGASNNNNVTAEFSIKECAFSSIGDGLTDTQASNFYTAVQAFQTTLSRQV